MFGKMQLPTSSPKVLVIDESSAFAEALSGALRAEGWVVRAATDGVAGSRLLREVPNPYAIVLEPNVVGTAWYQLIRLAGQARSSRLMVFTAYWSQALADEARLAGAEVCRRKPISPDDVRSMLGQPPPAGPLFESPGGPRPVSLAGVEWEHVNQTIRDCQGNMSQAARILGIHRPSLYKKLRKHAPAW